MQGCLQSSHTTLVNFTSNEMLNISGGGQASIQAQDGTFNTITIALDDPTVGFDKLQFNLDATANGFADFTAIDQFGNVFNFNNIALSGNGQNFFTLGSLDGQVAVSFTLVSTVGISLISELDQVRLGPATTTPVPAPAGLALMGLGLLGLGMVRRKAA
ncbi:PEP-CTERM sorting domain-containing protein [Sabulicella glaciei]|uniref:PEP-CTERM sorting domain-containing protein n=1 Tax=Sabulicella glaciei TaxID=2984948 RepID=UPI0026596B0F|nr:PEP-CTERM sorting domain-containing protein [Roseococcus sp. MDT2-1-1]